MNTMTRVLINQPAGYSDLIRLGFTLADFKKGREVLKVFLEDIRRDLIKQDADGLEIDFYYCNVCTFTAALAALCLAKRTGLTVRYSCDMGWKNPLLITVTPEQTLDDVRRDYVKRTEPWLEPTSWRSSFVPYGEGETPSYELPYENLEAFKRRQHNLLDSKATPKKSDRPAGHLKVLR